MIKTNEIHLTKQKLYKILFYRLLNTRWVVFLLIWGFAIFQYNLEKESELTYFFIVFSFIYPIIVLLNYYRYVNSHNNSIFYLKRTYQLLENKIVGILENGSISEISIDNIIKTIETKEYFLLYISENQFLYFPKEALDPDAIKFLENIKNSQRVSKPKGSILHPKNLLIAIFLIGSLIPFWGLIAALGLLINILVFKKFVKISIVFLILSVVSTVSMTFYAKYIGQKYDRIGFQEQMVPFCQMRINELVTKIEYFKMINSYYPETLDELKQLDSTITTKDFSYKIKSGYNPEYLELIYNLIDSNSYELFAIGRDSIPYTDDDIIPEITKMEINKTGLKRFIQK